MGDCFSKSKKVFKNIMRILIILFILFCTSVNAVDLAKYYKEPLTSNDKKGIVIFNVLQGIDMLQTLEIANNDDYYEKNPILGKHPSEAQVVTYFIARGFAHFHLTKMIPQRYRGLWHGYNVVYNYDVIRDNHAIGIRIDF